MIHTTLGNTVSGGLLAGAAYYNIYLARDGAIDIDFNIGVRTLPWKGGPMGHTSSKTQPMPNGYRDSEAEVTAGKAIEGRTLWRTATAQSSYLIWTRT